MKQIIPRVSREAIKEELNADCFIRNTNKAGNEIYIINHITAPNVMREIGRLREVSFRAAGGGTGLELDVDEMDNSDNCYQQIIVYCPEDEALIGGYRYIKGNDSFNKITQKHELSTLHYFDFSKQFIKDFLPNTIELGRSWVNPDYQPSVNPRKGMFALDNLWDGLGALMVDNPEIKYLFGKVTMYPDYNLEARDALLYFMQYFFPDNLDLVIPKNPLMIDSPEQNFNHIYKGKTYKDAHKSLNDYLKERGETIPPLINSYMSLSSTMRTFGTAINNDFGCVAETGILVTIADVYPIKTKRHTNSYIIEKKESDSK